MRRIGLYVAMTLVGLMVVLGASECEETSTEKQRSDAVDKRGKVFHRAEKKYPIPDQALNNFPLRQALVKMTEREDLVNHPWYVYILGENGNVIGYYVAQHSPVNSCNFLSSTEDTDNDSGVVLTAPSLDGVYYGGGGASAGCDSWFFFDAATDAMIRVRGMAFYTADSPLNLDAKAIKVERR